LRLEVAIRGALLLAAVGAIVLLVLPLSPAYDLDVFLRAGSAVLHGRAIYPPVGSPQVYSGSAFVYPWVSVTPFMPLATLPPQLARACFFALCAFAVIAATRYASDSDPWIPLIVLCTSFTITGLQLGAISPLLFVGVVCMWKLRDRPLAFGLLAAPVVVSKLFLAPLLVWPLLARRYRAVLIAGSLSAMLLAVGFLAGPLGLHQYADLLSALSAHEASSGFGLISVLRGGGLGPSSAELIAVAVESGLLAAAYARYRTTGDERILFGAALIGALVLTPVLWSHYLVLLPAALLALGAPRRWFLLLAVASWVIAPPHGLHWDLPVPEALESSGPWLALGALLLVFAYGTIAGRTGFDDRRRHRL
jgi:alpha-1,2-mannosyltransferase